MYFKLVLHVNTTKKKKIHFLSLVIYISLWFYCTCHTTAFLILCGIITIFIFGLFDLCSSISHRLLLHCILPPQSLCDIQTFPHREEEICLLVGCSTWTWALAISQASKWFIMHHITEFIAAMMRAWEPWFEGDILLMPIWNLQKTFLSVLNGLLCQYTILSGSQMQIKPYLLVISLMCSICAIYGVYF